MNLFARKALPADPAHGTGTGRFGIVHGGQACDRKAFSCGRFQDQKFPPTCESKDSDDRPPSSFKCFPHLLCWARRPPDFLHVVGSLLDRRSVGEGLSIISTGPWQMGSVEKNGYQS